MDDLRYPIGPFDKNQDVTNDMVRRAIDDIEAAPGKLREAVRGMSEEQLNTPYRPDGWTVRQVVHHLPDSHLNGYTRAKLALTEEEPTIRPYAEDRWAELPDGRSAPPEISLSLLEALHRRWMSLLRSLTAADLKRTFRHPVSGLWVLDKHFCLYAWHGRHHTAQITSLARRSGW
jgi:uncharacterized damage-inducible protein DinB